MKEKRTQVWIDRFQTQLFWRIACYLLFYQVAVWAAVLIEWHISIAVATLLGPEYGNRVVFVLIGVVLVIGAMFTYDAVVFTHRIVGPLVRFRRVCQAIRDGEPAVLVKLRKGDFLQELKDEFNDMLKALEQRGALTLDVPGEKSPQSEQPETASKQ